MAEPTYSLGRRMAAWGVHLYTAMGLPLAYLCVEALQDGNARRFFLFQTLACLIDASDGWLARKVDVKHVLPGFSGRRLDDIVDYIHFVALPLAALIPLGALPAAWAPLIIVPMMASAYGFCQEMAKTDDSFVGFPSYWNILTLYLVVLGAGAKLTAAVLVALSVMVFVPIHYLYPSKTRLLQTWTVGLGLIWTAMVVAISLRPDASWARKVAWVSLYYPLWYFVLSLVHHRDIKRREAAGGFPTPG